MKKTVLLSLFAWCLPALLAAQGYDDDLYYVPGKDKGTVKTIQKDVKTTTTVYTTPQTRVVVQERKTKKVRDVDEYNRRYDTTDYTFQRNGDTLYVEERSESGAPQGEWVNGFDGSQEDYEYAERIIRFHNPRYAVHISSPLYWDMMYGLNSWDWNVYTDGWYAYAFPTFSNRLWWDWRFNSFGRGWGGYYGGYYSGGYGGYWGGDYWGHYSPYYYGGWGHGHSNYVTSRRHAAYDGSSVRRSGNRAPDAWNRRSASSRTPVYSRQGNTRPAGTVDSNRSTSVRNNATPSTSRRSSNDSSNSSYNNNDSSSGNNSSRSSSYSSGSSSYSGSRSGSGVSSGSSGRRR
jgi:hypothetical protein